MTAGQRVRHAVSWPLRAFFDRRFMQLESEVDDAQRALAALIDQRVSALLVPLETASEEVRQQLAATSETLTYVGVELRRLTEAVEDANRPGPDDR